LKFFPGRWQVVLAEVDEIFLTHISFFPSHYCALSIHGNPLEHSKQKARRDVGKTQI
jgi:hypothetical protein